MKRLLIFSGLCVGICWAGPVWNDAAPLTKQNVVVALEDGRFLRIDVLNDALFRIRCSTTPQWTESAMNRYGVLTREFSGCAFQQESNAVITAQARLEVSKKGSLLLKGARCAVPITPQIAGKGMAIRFGLEKDERIYGLGDICRDNIMRRGGSYECWVKNVTSYIPVPMAMSQKGWGVLFNTTWRHTLDVGKADPDAMVCSAAESNLDFYLFCGADFRAMLNTYTQLTGRSALLPIWGYGFTYVCNQNIDAFNLVNEAMEFRKQEMPCDVMGLEPGWMQKFYDFSTQKQWHKERFYFPYWAPKGGHTFIGALTRKGFKLSLWLCCDYDLGVYEEQLVAGRVRAQGGVPVLPEGIPETWQDDRITTTNAVAKKAAESKVEAPEGTQPWFEHLKFFVSQGVAAFKLDGANQVTEHPQRKWANGMSDEEMHNLYPLIYGKQMAQGFEACTQRRAMVYSAGGYAGIQQYVATWAGDTGGGAQPLASMLNLAMSGHSNHSCDMDIHHIEGIHFGFLQTWAQQNNWDYWYQPWLNRDELIPAFRAYGQLRYRLLPYLYSSAAEAALTGWPVMRAMPLVYPDDPQWDARKGQYLLGDALLVSAYVKKILLPAGRWYDFWSGEAVEGNREVDVKVTAEHGGALYVKAGAIIPTWPLKQNVSKGWNEQVILLVYPAEASSFDLYEDDGASLEYRSGSYAKTTVRCERKDKVVTVSIGGRKGQYKGMPATREMVCQIRLDKKPAKVQVAGQDTEVVWNEGSQTVKVVLTGCGNEQKTCVITE